MWRRSPRPRSGFVGSYASVIVRGVIIYHRGVCVVRHVVELQLLKPVGVMICLGPHCRMSILKAAGSEVWCSILQYL